jgi:TP901 family phage tail tape measure protein
MAGRFSVEAIFTAIDRMSRPVAKIEGRIARFARLSSSNLKSVDSAFSGINKVIGRAGIAVGAGAAAAGAGILNVVKSGADFEQAITNVGAVSLMSRDDVADLEVAARALGKSTKYSATQVASGMELMGKAGATNADILAGIGPLLNAAAAEGADFEQTAGVVSSTIKGMNMEWTQAQRVADVLTLASARTNSSITSLGESMATASTTATQFKVPLEDTVAAVALLQDVGLDASEAGTAMNTMLTKLAKPTDTVAAQMQSMGIKFQDAHGNMLPLTAVLGQLTKASKKAGGNMKQAAFFADLVGLRGQKAAIKLKDLLASGKYGELLEELKKASGKAEEMANLRMDTLLGDWTKFENAVEDVKISLYDTQSGPLRATVQSMTDWVNANHELIATKLGEFVEGLKRGLPELVADLRASWRSASDFGSAIKEFLPDLVSTIRFTFWAVKTFYKLWFALKVLQGIVYTSRAAILAWQLAAKLWALATGRAALAQDALAASTAASTGAVDAAALAYRNSQLALAGVSTEATAAGGLLGGLRAKLNAGSLAKSINGIESKLGKYGLLAAVGAVGFAFGTWLDNKFKISDFLADTLAQVTGVNDELDKAGGRSKKRGIQEGEPRVYADGTVVSASGKILEKGSEWQKHVREPLPQIITPEEAAAFGGGWNLEKSTTENVELTIKDKTGTASVKRGKKPAKRASIKLEPSGAF